MTRAPDPSYDADLAASVERHTADLAEPDGKSEQERADRALIGAKLDAIRSLVGATDEHTFDHVTLRGVASQIEQHARAIARLTEGMR